MLPPASASRVSRGAATRGVLATAAAMVMLATAAVLPPVGVEGLEAAPGKRRDVGDLIVLEVSGSYEEMGRQQAALLGEDLRRAFDWQRAAYRRALGGGGLGLRLLDALAIPLWSALGGHFEDSHFHAEIAGIARELGVPRREVLRALLAVSGGSTVFAATRSATTDGQALLGRNVDWDDREGLLRPLAIHLRPEGGDLAHISVGWPLSGLPTVGVNEAGLALSFNYFLADPQVGLRLPQWPHRSALQRARSVEEGIRLFLSARERGIACFMVMADAAGDIAMVECTPARCAVYRPEGDSFGHANHARTPEMIPFDLSRSPDSFDRQAGIERALTPHLGRLTPARAVEILRDRSTHPWPNASNVANLAVLNAVVVHPVSRTLWHATTMQPHAAFGPYEAFTLGDAPVPPPLPASPLLAGEAFAREREAVAVGRYALRALAEGRPADAVAPLEALLTQDPPVLDPARLAIGLALAHLRSGRAEEAAVALDPSLDPAAPEDVRIAATALKAHLAERLERPDEALARRRTALALIEARPEWNAFDGLAAWAREGLAAPAPEREPPLSLYLLRLPF